MKNITHNDGRIFATTEILVNGISPGKIFEFMLNLDKQKFIQWHPADHVDFKIVKQSPEIKGNVFYFNELIGGKYKIAHTWEIRDFKRDEMLLMKATIAIPVFLKLNFTKENNNTRIVHQLQMGFKGLTFLNKLIAAFAFSGNRQEVSDRHAFEEFKNLEVLLQ
jgi:hypothetical protein